MEIFRCVNYVAKKSWKKKKKATECFKIKIKNTRIYLYIQSASGGVKAH